MKLRWLHIKGFKSVRDIDFEVDDFTCFIGQNNHGKSNIFQALDLFFSSGAAHAEHFFRSPTTIERDITIEARFMELSPEEMEKLNPWCVDGTLTVSKKYSIDVEGKTQIIYDAIMRVPKNEWLNEEFENYHDRSIVEGLPIYDFIPEKGRITKQIYKDAIQKYIESHTDIEYHEEKRSNPAGYKQVLDGYLPEFYLVPAVRDVTDEVKPSGAALFSRILSVIVGHIAKHNPAFERLVTAVQEIKKLIEGETPETKLVEIRQLESKLEQELKPWNIKLNIGVEIPDVERVFQLGTNVSLDDGIPTSISEKGHGLQRSLIFALMRVWSSVLKESRIEEDSGHKERSHFFAFEEPELFLHPQMCRATFESLKKISETDQIFICTHSPHLIDMEDYKSIIIVRKPDLETGTKIQQVREELYDGEKKRQFNMIRYFNPDRNELFFARKTILVEGATEKVILPLLSRRLDLFDHSVSIIDCGSKFNLTLFMVVLNAFRIPYIVIHDEDPIAPEFMPGGLKYTPELYADANRNYIENRKISETCDPEIGNIIMIPDKFEKLLGVTDSQVKKLGKPFAAVEKYANDAEPIPRALVELIKEVNK